ncbi:hypothetical protein HYH03_000389 [Edaphochlamys debaryana]|uniref:EGF-like domain-containing protein n=1 Tax=Edaphochlamys debaryana TaxID=47281 RepID=A0A835YJ46_9CHLO|nr:hypothetical protein HYH03_000389 [Edaphochlamys debaryana]|eukprot:KAG2501891.1 hypothetical protein HYH03_000389 [Edaphochlamys debaryana]
MADYCQPKADKDNKPSFHPNSGITWEQIYGDNGWCNAQQSTIQCSCHQEIATPCDGSVPMEQTCLNQCSGHGDCHMGYCRCLEGWYGSDCSRKKAGSPMEPGVQATRPWIERLVTIPPAAMETPPKPTRPRPLIYVYDVPADYTTRMLQYRLIGQACLYRRFHEGNHTSFTSWTYSIESYLHEALLTSEHRTFDPEEADFFYVPVYVTCYFWPIMGYADHPWYHSPYGFRVMHGANLVREVHEWVKTALPYWKRRGGRDHIWLFAADEGACWAPTEIFNTSIMLTHWGRMDLNHTSNTAYLADNYNGPLAPEFLPWKGLDFQEHIKGHPCYDPKKDLVIPAWKPPDHYKQSPLMGAPPVERDILLYFRGEVGSNRLEHYSRKIRQRMFKLAYENKWWDKHKILIGASGQVGGSYSEQLARSKFCLVAPGDGWSTRAEDAIVHGCVPLIVMDEVHGVYESILDYASFSIRIRESALEAVPDILNAVTPAQLAKMQRHLAKVWHRFTYTTGRVMKEAVKRVMLDNLDAGHSPNAPRGQVRSDHPFQRHTSFPFEDDAFGTIMQWLYHRIPFTRG